MSLLNAPALVAVPGLSFSRKIEANILRWFAVQKYAVPEFEV